MITLIPQQVINFEVFNEGNRLLGLASVDLGTLEKKTAEIAGNGIAGSIDMPTIGQFTAPELTLHWRVIYENPIKMLKDGGQMLSLRGAEQKYDSGTGELKVLPVRVDVRGHMKSTNLGKFEPSTTGDVETTLVCDYVKVTVDGDEQLLEFDLFNYVYKVGGNDYMADILGAVGL